MRSYDVRNDRRAPKHYSLETHKSLRSHKEARVALLDHLLLQLLDAASATPVVHLLHITGSEHVDVLVPPPLAFVEILGAILSFQLGKELVVIVCVLSMNSIVLIVSNWYYVRFMNRKKSNV